MLELKLKPHDCALNPNRSLNRNRENVGCHISYQLMSAFISVYCFHSRFAIARYGFNENVATCSKQTHIERSTPKSNFKNSDIKNQGVT